MSESLREKIYHSIRDEISYGKLSPGEQIFEEAIAKRFNVSRTPLREAIRQLQMERYIRVIPNVGAFVSKISISDIEDIYDLIDIKDYTIPPPPTCPDGSPQLPGEPCEPIEED